MPRKFYRQNSTKRSVVLTEDQSHWVKIGYEEVRLMCLFHAKAQRRKGDPKRLSYLCVFASLREKTVDNNQIALELRILTED